MIVCYYKNITNTQLISNDATAVDNLGELDIDVWGACVLNIYWSILILLIYYNYNFYDGVFMTVYASFNY